LNELKRDIFLPHANTEHVNIVLFFKNRVMLNDYMYINKTLYISNYETY